VILKLIIFAVAGYFIYKLLGGKLPSLKTGAGKNAGRSRRKTKEEKQLDEDTLVECEKCDTYVTIKESILINGKYYCDECAEKV
jgi:uncharacterized protein